MLMPSYICEDGNRLRLEGPPELLCEPRSALDQERLKSMAQLPIPKVGEQVETKASHRDSRIFSAEVKESWRGTNGELYFRLKSKELAAPYVEPLKNIRRGKGWTEAENLDLLLGRRVRRRSSSEIEPQAVVHSKGEGRLHSSSLTKQRRSSGGGFSSTGGSSRSVVHTTNSRYILNNHINRNNHSNTTNGRSCVLPIRSCTSRLPSSCYRVRPSRNSTSSSSAASFLFSLNLNSLADLENLPPPVGAFSPSPYPPSPSLPFRSKKLTLSCCDNRLKVVEEPVGEEEVGDCVPSRRCTCHRVGLTQRCQDDVFNDKGTCEEGEPEEEENKGIKTAGAVAVSRGRGKKRKYGRDLYQHCSGVRSNGNRSTLNIRKFTSSRYRDDKTSTSSSCNTTSGNCSSDNNSSSSSSGADSTPTSTKNYPLVPPSKYHGTTTRGSSGGELSPYGSFTLTSANSNKTFVYKKQYASPTFPSMVRTPHRAPQKRRKVIKKNAGLNKDIHLNTLPLGNSLPLYTTYGRETKSGNSDSSKSSNGSCKNGDSTTSRTSIDSNPTTDSITNSNSSINTCV